MPIVESSVENTGEKYKHITMEKDYIDLPSTPERCRHNGHIFYIKVKGITERTEIIKYLQKNEVNSVFHYIPLHSAIGGKKFGVFHGKDRWTTKESERLLRPC